MKKTASILAAMAFLLFLAPGVSFSGEVDLSGTWVGTTEVPDNPEMDEMTLILEKTEKGYTGTISDSFGFAQEEELEDVEFKDETLSFSFTIYNGEEYMLVYVDLTVGEDSMSGSWKLEDGTSASIELKRKE